MTSDQRSDRPGDRPEDGAPVAVAVPPLPPDAPGSAVATPNIPLESGRRFKTFDSLIDVPAYRWYMVAMMGNFSALQMQNVARGWLAYAITGNYTSIAFVELANTVPRLFLALYGGVLADRASRRVIIQFGQGVNAINAGVIAVLLFTGNLQLWHLFAVSFVQGVLNSFVLPARQSMVPEIVGPTRLMNAFALNAFAMNVTRTAAPALAGGIIAALMVSSGGNTFFSVGVVFALMAAFNAAAVVALFPVPKTTARTRAALRGEDAPPTRARGEDRLGWQDIKDGISYLAREPIIVWLMVIHSSTAMLGIVYQRLLPGFVERVMGASRETSAAVMGSLLTVTAIGAIVGSLVIASLPDRNRGKILAYSLALFGVTLIAFAASTVFWLSAGIVLVLGIGQAVRQTVANVLIQARVDDLYRGRVSAMMLLDDPLESLGVVGIALAADIVGAQYALAGVGFLMVIYAAVIWSAKRIRNLD